jgi:hypothetical protein
MSAARGDEAAIDSLTRAITYNLQKGAFSIWPCEHKPPCKRPTEDQVEKLGEVLINRLGADGIKFFKMLGGFNSDDRCPGQFNGR